MMGWVRSDAVSAGQHTRLWARVIVLERGGQKMALVAEDLGGIPGGMLAEAAERVSDLGFSQRNVLDSASHTHSGPTGFFNFSTFNTVFMTINSPTDFQLTGGLDPQLYTFMVRRLELAIRRADANLGPGKLGWGKTQITDLTDNRSVEAHLRNHGIREEFGEGSADQDPQGRLHTLDPDVNVLRVDKMIGGRQVPVGMWSTFADHGTVVRYQFTYYNRDHHGAATQLVEDAIRRAGQVPPDQEVVNAYGNTDEGDQTAGLHRAGPAAADYVGRVEASAFMRAWRQAGSQMTATPILGRRWTRMCWCGQQTAAGPVADRAEFGLPQFTGSEEGRGPLFDVTGVPFEGHHQPVGTGPQGNKIAAPLPVEVPEAVPLMALRIGPRMIVSIPGEMTAGMGRRVRDAVTDAARGSGVTGAVISGLANEYVDYFTTPAGVRRPALRGRGDHLRTRQRGGAPGGLGRSHPSAWSRAARRRSPIRTTRETGSRPTPPRSRSAPRAPPSPASTARKPGGWGAPASPGAARCAASTARSNAPSSRSSAAPRAAAGKPSTRTSASPCCGESTRTASTWPAGSRASTSLSARYRFRITANRYALTSNPFDLRANKGLRPRRVAAPAGKVAVVLDYPRARVREEIGDPLPDASASLTHRPPSAASGRVTFIVDGQPITVQAGPGGRFEVSANPGDQIRIPAGAGRDGFGNRTGQDFAFQA